MAGENKARLIRAKAASIVRKAGVRRGGDGDPEGADLLKDLADEIANLPIEGD